MYSNPGDGAGSKEIFRDNKKQLIIPIMLLNDIYRKRQYQS